MRIRLRLPFEIRRRQVIQIDGVVQIEQRLFLLRQCALDRFAVGMQPVQIPIQRLVLEFGEIFLQDVSQGRASNPIRHRMFRQRTNQTVQGHHFRQRAGAFAKSRFLQDAVHAQLAPQLVSDMHRPRFACLLDLDLVGFDGDRRSGAIFNGWSRASVFSSRFLHPPLDLLG